MFEWYKEWYKDEDIGIFFSQKPHIDVRYVNSNMDEKQKKDIESKPFENKNNISVLLWDYTNNKNYEFNIPAGYTWDGGSIPRFFWRLIGPKTDNRFLIPSLIHDVLCENHNYVDNDRYFSTQVFERLLYVSGVGSFKRWMMKHSVDNFQKFCGWSRTK